MHLHRGLVSLVDKIGFVRTFIYIGLLVFGGYLLVSWMQPRGSPSLRQGRHVLHQMMGRETLERAGFFAAHPEGFPSNFVDFIKSDAGAVLWPITISEHRRSLELAPRAVPSTGRALRPDDLIFSANATDPSAAAQIVYLPLDETREIEVRGYEDPDGPPAFVEHWAFPSDARPVLPAN